MSTAARFAGLAALLALGNFVYQWMTGHNWLIATERSYFQAAALFVAWYSLGRTQ